MLESNCNAQTRMDSAPGDTSCLDLHLHWLATISRQQTHWRGGAFRFSLFAFRPFEICHSDRSGPTFFSAPPLGASGRAVEESWHYSRVPQVRFSTWVLGLPRYSVQRGT